MNDSRNDSMSDSIIDSLNATLNDSLNVTGLSTDHSDPFNWSMLTPEDQSMEENKENIHDHHDNNLSGLDANSNGNTSANFNGWRPYATAESPRRFNPRDCLSLTSTSSHSATPPGKPSKCNKSTPNTPSSSAEPRYPRRDRTPRQELYQYELQGNKLVDKNQGQKSPQKKKFDFNLYEWASCEVSISYDKIKGFYPLQSTSDVPGILIAYFPGRRPKNCELPPKSPTKTPKTSPTKTPRKSAPKTPSTPGSTPRSNKSNGRKRKKTKVFVSDEEDDAFYDDNDIQIQSFYEEAFSFGASAQTQMENFQQLTPISPEPQFFEDYINMSTPGITEMLRPIIDHNENAQVGESSAYPEDRNSLIEPNQSAPNKIYTRNAIEDFGMPKVINITPFYGDPADLSKGHSSKKEIGNTVREIPDNTLSGLEDFKSLLDTNIIGVNSWRRFALSNIVLQDRRPQEEIAMNNSEINAFLATQRRMCLGPYQRAPARFDAKVWMKLSKQASDAKKSVARMGTTLTHALPNDDDANRSPKSENSVTIIDLCDSTTGDTFLERAMANYVPEEPRKKHFYLDNESNDSDVVIVEDADVEESTSEPSSNATKGSNDSEVSNSDKFNDDSVDGDDENDSENENI